MTNDDCPPIWWVIVPISLLLAAFLVNLLAAELEAWTDCLLRGSRSRQPRRRPTPRTTTPTQGRTINRENSERGRVVRRGNRMMRVWDEVSPSPSTQSRGDRQGRMGNDDERDGDYVPAPTSGPPDMTVPPPRMVLRSAGRRRSLGLHEGRDTNWRQRTNTAQDGEDPQTGEQGEQSNVRRRRPRGAEKQPNREEDV